MPAPPFMRFYVQAYRKDTVTLSFEEQGVYMRLLTTMWEYGGEVEDNDYVISRSMPIQIQKWQKVKPHIMPKLMEHRPGYLTQKKLHEQFHSITGDKTSNKDSNNPQPDEGRYPPRSQQHTQPPPQRPYQGPTQGAQVAKSIGEIAQGIVNQQIDESPHASARDRLARALDQSKSRSNRDIESRLLDDGNDEACGKTLSIEDADLFISEAFDAFEKHGLNAPSDITVVASWIKNGCDLNRHILPAIRAALNRHGGRIKPPKSWKYFTHEVYGRKKKEIING